MTRLLAIDPGTTESGWVVLEGGKITDNGVSENERMLELVDAYAWAGSGNACAIEMIASYGMAVGKEVFETCCWIGRFEQAWHRKTGNYPDRVFRQQVKLHLCGSARAKDANIRAALLDLLGPQGTKKNPGPLYGVKSHAWSALAVGVTHLKLQ